MSRRSSKRLIIVAVALSGIVVMLVLALPRLTRDWRDHAQATAAERTFGEARLEGGRLLIWQERASDGVPALTLWARPTDARLTWSDFATAKVQPSVDDKQSYWGFEILLGDHSTLGDARPTACMRGRLPFSECTFTTAVVQVSRVRTAFDIFDALAKADAAGADVKATRRFPPRLQRFWSEDAAGIAAFKGWDCEESDWTEVCHRASMLQQWAPAMFGLRPHAAFVEDDGGYFMFQGRLVHVRRTLGTATGHALIPAAWRALMRQAREVSFPPETADEIAIAQRDATSCTELAEEFVRWKATRHLSEKANREWGLRSTPCIRAAEVGVRVRQAPPAERVKLLTSLTDALWAAEGQVQSHHYRIYESLIAALGETNAPSPTLVTAASRYYSSIGQSGAADARRRAEEFLNTARALALSPPAATNEQALLRLRHSVVGYYSFRQQRPERLQFLREWLAKEQAAHGSGAAALLEPLRILVHELAIEAETDELRSALNRLLMVWLQQPPECTGQDAAKRDAEIGFTLLRNYHVYALRTRQGASVAPMLTDIVQRLQTCYGSSHALIMQASQIQQDIAAGRPPARPE